MGLEQVTLQLLVLRVEPVPVRLHLLEVLRVVVGTVRLAQIRHQDLELGDVARGRQPWRFEIDHQGLGVPERGQHLPVGLSAAHRHVGENLRDEFPSSYGVNSDLHGADDGQAAEPETDDLLVVPERTGTDIHRLNPPLDIRNAQGRRPRRRPLFRLSQRLAKRRWPLCRFGQGRLYHGHISVKQQNATVVLAANGEFGELRRRRRLN